jgi:Cu-processing system ATP-binding protein
LPGGFEMIWIKNISKKFGHMGVLDDISLTVRQGAVTAVLGPNASGKTTLIKCILGLVTPDSGEIHVGDEPVIGNWTYRKQLGYMPQIARFPDNLLVDELFTMLRDLRGGATGDTMDEELIERFHIDSIRRRRLGTLSGGTRQKVNAAIAFLFSPKVLLLDEPTVGLDPVSATRLKDKVRKERDAGVTVLLTTHLVGEVEELADHVVYMLEGRPYFDGSVEELRQSTNQTTLERAIVRLTEKADGQDSLENPEVRNT